MSVGGETEMRLSQLAHLRGMHPDVIRRMIDNVCFIAEHFRAQQRLDKVPFILFLNNYRISVLFIY